MNIDEEIRRVSQKIIECNEAYRNGERIVSDEEYDQMIEWLRSVDPNNPLVTEVQKDTVSSNREKFDFGDTPMLSLNKVYSIEDLIKWMKSISRNEYEEFLLQPKYDGLSGCIDGDKKILSTRGDGQTGEIINTKISMIKFDKWTKDVDGSLDSLTGVQTPFYFPISGQLRGEIIIRKDRFDSLKSVVKKKDGQDYKNTRNCVSGLMNPMSSSSDDLETSMKLEENGLNITFISHDEISEVVRLNDENLAEKIEQTWDFYLKNLPYDQDGLVVKLKDKVYGDSLGNTSHHPRSGMALKRNANGEWTKLVGIDWTVGMSGELTPTGIVEPIEIDGVTVEHVLLHNLQQIIDRDLRIGCEISIIRSGGVIPKWIDNSKANTNHTNRYENLGLDTKECQGYGGNPDIILIKNDTEYLVCPCCGSYVRYDSEISPDCYCSNIDCYDRRMKRLYNAVSKCFDIKGLAEETLEKIATKYHIKNFYQLLDLEMWQLQNLDGFAEKSAEILYSAIQKARNCTDVQVLASMGIPMIGNRVSKDLLTLMPLSILREASVDSLIEIKGFGEAKARSVTTGLSYYSNELDELLARVEVKQTYSASKKAEAEGKPTICFTGEAPFPRSKCQEIARQNGYEPISGVNKNLAVLVCADADTNSNISTKTKKAMNYGIKIVPFSEWFESLENKEIPGMSKETSLGYSNPLVDEILDI